MVADYYVCRTALNSVEFWLDTRALMTEGLSVSIVCSTWKAGRLISVICYGNMSASSASYSSEASQITGAVVGSDSSSTGNSSKGLTSSANSLQCKLHVSAQYQQAVYKII